MKFSWRRRKAGKTIQISEEENSDMEVTIPAHFRCPISLDLMKDPVTLSTGMTYDRENIEKWIEGGNQTCPVTLQALSCFDQIPNHTIRRMIQEWCVENRDLGIERIPTPRIPVTPQEISAICSEIAAATQRSDGRKCGELVGKLKTWGKESERNKKCISENGAGFVLTVSFEHFARVSEGNNEYYYDDLLEDILGILIWIFPMIGIESQARLGSLSSLSSTARFLRSEDLWRRKIAVVALKELLSLNQQYVNSLAEIHGVSDALFKIVREPISPTATKASLTVIFFMISSTDLDDKIASEFLEIGLISLILEILVDAGGGNRGITEKALAVLNNICNGDRGIEQARAHALMVPVLVKKILRVSDEATELCVSVLCKLCKNEGGGEGSCVTEAVQAGAFQKVVVVLQVGCGDETKEKATELLKMMNQYRNRFECFDSSSMDHRFRYLKRST